jgi:hypothetical protein
MIRRTDMRNNFTGRLWLAILSCGLAMSLSACEKRTKTSSVGGGSSSQSVLSISGAGQ